MLLLLQYFFSALTLLLVQLQKAHKMLHTFRRLFFAIPCLAWNNSKTISVKNKPAVVLVGGVEQW